jgi:hypothetical protein
LPSNYIRFDDQREWPWTALWTTDKELIEKLNHG